jgi:protein O-GlcNAc transferase
MSSPNRNAPCPCGSGKKYKQCCLKRDEALAATMRAGGNPVARMLQEALAHHQAGRLPDAESLYQQILMVAPDHSDALHLLGVIAFQKGQNEMAAELIGRSVGIKPTAVAYCNLGDAFLGLGRPEDAVASYRQAITLQPDYAEAHFSLGIAFQNRGRMSDAAACYREAIAIRPDYAGAHNNLGHILQIQNRPDEAIRHCLDALALDPDFVEAYCNMGNAFQAQGKLEEAVECHRRTIVLRPGYAEGHSNLGNVLRSQGRLDEAIAHLRAAVALKPDFAEAYCNMGNALQAQGKLDEAIEVYRQAIVLKPDLVEAQNNLAAVLIRLGRMDEAILYCRQALALAPDYAEARHNLGNAFKDQGLLDDAIKNYREALRLKPEYADAQSGLLFCLNYHPDMSAEEIFRAYQEYDSQQCQPLKSAWRAHDNDRNPDRRLRVGYVSPDFRQHSVRLFLEPLLANHDKAQVEVYAYAELFVEDEMSLRYKSYADHWVPTKGMSDEALAERVRRDGIDILVELAGHTADNRLLTFARKPAPVSVSWLGYGYTTGLSAIDYYLTDEACAPLGSEALFAEQPWRIATPAYVYRPASGMGEVGDLPALRRGHITFGTLTRSVRINHRTIRVWSELLKAVPNSLLVIDSFHFKESEMRERLAARFAQHGIERERLEIGFNSPPWDVLRGTDIGLDCFPHNSGTTLFETLYMGVPYITLAGRPSVGRLGSSILHGVGHPEWIAENEDEYIARAAELAGEIPRLARVRTALRDEMRACPLMDEPGFARKVEGAYRGMWKAWCERGGAA